MSDDDSGGWDFKNKWNIALWILGVIIALILAQSH